MIQILPDRRRLGGVALGALWIGDSGDERSELEDAEDGGIGAVLNVAQDMLAVHQWSNGIEVGHVGIVDGPGNELSIYCAAVLALHSLMRRHNVLVCCHSGGRSVAVAVMHLNLKSPRGWDSWVELLGERVGVLPTVHEVHREAFGRIDWRSLAELTK